MEIWAEMKARHKREAIQLIQAYADHYTIQQTADILQMDQVQLRTFAYNNRIQFQKVYNDKRTATQPSE
jgi:hypothetical protein